MGSESLPVPYHLWWKWGNGPQSTLPDCTVQNIVGPLRILLSLGKAWGRAREASRSKRTTENVAFALPWEACRLEASSSSFLYLCQEWLSECSQQLEQRNENNDSILVRSFDSIDPAFSEARNTYSGDFQFCDIILFVAKLFWVDFVVFF